MSDNCAVAISSKALATAKNVQQARLRTKGIKMSIGAIVSEAVSEAFGEYAIAENAVIENASAQPSTLSQAG